MGDSWERVFFGSLERDGTGDDDGDGLHDAAEYGIGTDPTREDTDGDGEIDLEEYVYGSDPTDPTVQWEPHRPDEPSLPSAGEAPLRDFKLTGSEFADPDGDAMLLADWQISRTSDFETLVFDRRIENGTSVTLPLGVLEPSTEYFMRTRYWDVEGLPSEWSNVLELTSADGYPNDADGNGVDDTYQVDGFTDVNENGVDDVTEGMCNLFDAEGNNVIGFRSALGTIRCFTSLGGRNLPADELPEGQMPYGMFAFVVEGLPVDPMNPARIEVEVYLPAPMKRKAWYKFDEGENRVVDYTNSVRFNDRRVSVMLTDGGRGDQDGVVNGIIVDPSGPVLPPAEDDDDDEPVAGGPQGAPAAPDGEGGGGGLGWPLLGMLALLGGRRMRKAA